MAMIISIGGASNAGKTTLAGILREELKDTSVKIIHQDDFIVPVENIPKVKDRIDWEDPSSIDFEAFHKAITEAAKNYRIVIAEGFLVYYHQDLNKLYDKKIFLKIPKKIFIERKILDKRWGFEPAWYLEHIWQSYLKYGMVSTQYTDILHLDGDKEIPLTALFRFLEIESFIYSLEGDTLTN